MGKYALILGGDTLKQTIKVAQQAEAAGFHSVWSSELQRDAFTQLTAVAMATNRIVLGTGVVLAFTRSPLITALTALDLDELSEGRLILGMGTGVKRLNESWHGAVFGKPAPHIRETTQVVRLLMEKVSSGEDVRYNGEYYNLDLRGFRRSHPRGRERVPIFLAGIGPIMCRVAGEVGDGWVGHSMNTLGWMQKVILPNIEKGLQRSGRSRQDFQTCMSVTCAIGSDRAAARRAAAGTVAFYATVRTYEPLFELHGFLDRARQIQEVFRRGERSAMVDLVTDEMVDAFAVAGSPDEVRTRLKEYEAVVDIVKFNPPSHFLTDAEINSYQELVVETFGK